jgi:hypothetical protein
MSSSKLAIGACVLAATTLGGCSWGSSDGDGSSGGGTGSGGPSSSSTQQQSSSSVRYPLTQSEAERLLAQGEPVAGVLPKGGELTLQQTTETQYRRDPSAQKEVCGWKYDVSRGKNVYGCRFQPDLEQRPYAVTVYALNGPGLIGAHYPDASSAIRAAAEDGASSWRLNR